MWSYGTLRQYLTSAGSRQPMISSINLPMKFERSSLHDQYSSANMIVITRSVTTGSAGSGEW